MGGRTHTSKLESENLEGAVYKAYQEWGKGNLDPQKSMSRLRLSHLKLGLLGLTQHPTPRHLGSTKTLTCKKTNYYRRWSSHRSSPH